MSKQIPWTSGYIEHKYDFIGEVIRSDMILHFKSGQLPKGYGYHLDERAVEYPWFFANLAPSLNTILDAGSVLNHRQILSVPQLKDRKLFISTLYYEGHPDATPSPSYIYEDLRSTCYKSDLFDAICCLSTLEHVGMDNTFLYTPDNNKKENDKYAYLEVIKEFKRILRQDGNLFISLPYGIYKNHTWLQVFDFEMIQRSIDTFSPRNTELTYFRYENDQWNFSSESACNDGYIFDIHNNKNYEPDYLSFARCVICLKLTK
jgi:SAM-dependent methyltransferase